MITEDYVSFEIAKLLKEKGFDETCRAFWKVWDKHTTLCDCSPSHMFEYCHNSMLEQYNDDDEELNIAAPTLQMAMKWLRKKYNLHITLPYYIEGFYGFEICDIKKSIVVGYNTEDIKYAEPEEACEAAIKYCLENLI
jgi:hypothetical protein